MIKVKEFFGETREENGEFYFVPLEGVINEFFHNNNVEYLDIKYYVSENISSALLVYKEI